MQRFVFTDSLLLKVKVCLTVSFLGCLSINAQGPGYEPPKILTPSPTVAGLMKFEETPVNNYNGIPDISIPVYSVGTHSKEININLSLRYHPSSIAVEEEASYIGLGWSLFGAGTISRTVRGFPDEDSSAGHYGINDGVNNPYFEAIEYIGLTPPPPEDDILPTFLWDVQVNGKYDSEHDLYQFNFMGHSGRFILVNKCSLSSPCYEIKKLDNDNALKIEFLPYSRTFRIYDDKGFRFDFDVKELTRSNSVTNLTPFAGSPTTVYSPQEDYTSAFHLSKIYNASGLLLVEFRYNDDLHEIPEATPSGTTITRFLPTLNTDLQNIDFLCSTTDPGKVLQPRIATTHHGLITKTKKLTQIDVIDFATIDFVMEGLRQDKENPNTYRLKGITVKNKRNELIKNIELFHNYSEIKFRPLDPNGGKKIKRMMLSKVSEYYGNKTLSYEMDYLKRREDDFTTLYKDYWGYITAKPDYEPDGDFKEAHPFYGKLDILQKMKLPSGGSIVYFFEPNTYSYIGASPVMDFTKNPFNWYKFTVPYIMGLTPQNKPLEYSDYDQYVNFSSGSAGLAGTLWQQDTNGSWSQITPYSGDRILTGGYHYELRMGGTQLGGPTGLQTNVTYFTVKSPEKKYLFGGGVRLGKVGVFDAEVNPLYYEADPNFDFDYYGFSVKDNIIPAKEKNYNYNFFNDPAKSSGSLVFAKPIYDYEETTQGRITCGVGNGGTGVNVVETVFSYTYQSSTDYNNLKAIKTQGSDVGYQNVQVSETGNGYSQYLYTSPIDIPENSYTFAPPFISTNTNRDNERGILLKESHFNQNNDILSEIINFHNPIAGKIMTGLHVFVTKDCPFVGDYLGNYLGYKGSINNCDNNPSDPNKMVECAACLKAANYLGLLPAEDAYAWMQLKERITTKYFYESGTRSAVTTKELFDYNLTNKQISKYETYNSNGDVLKTNYAYRTLPDNNISNYYYIQNYENGIVSKIVGFTYTQPGNQMNNPNYLLEEMYYIKRPLINDRHHSLYSVNKYDQYGNFVNGYSGTRETNYSQKYYVWGYRGTMPIAIIESNYTVDSTGEPSVIPESLLSAARTASNTGNEAELLTALNDIRAAMPDRLITTFTYKPLVGMTSVTDPNGIITRYTYDEFHRLSSVKDADGNLLQENMYNYKNQ